jgi:hypothetical protein
MEKSHKVIESRNNVVLKKVDFMPLEVYNSLRLDL